MLHVKSSDGQPLCCPSFKRVLIIAGASFAFFASCEKVRLTNPPLATTKQTASESVTSENRGTPRLEIHPEALVFNAKALQEQAARKGVQIAAVVKGARAHPAVVRAMQEAGIKMLADSRLSNVRRIREAGYTAEVMLLRSASMQQAPDVVRLADISLVGHIDVARALSKAASEASRTHKVVLMVELGDLREGVYPPEAIPTLAGEIEKLPGLALHGLGANFACSSGVLPSEESLHSISQAKRLVEEKIGRPLTLGSVGNSSGLVHMQSCPLPAGANHYRIGESILLGTNAIDGSPWEGTRQDTFTFVAEVIEVYRKPSLPWGPLAKNAFGETESFTDKGERVRAILNAGRQDVVHTGLKPMTPCMEVITSSSDHLLIDVEDCEPKPKVGDDIRFHVNYPALLQASTSEDVFKVEVSRP